MLKLIQTNNGNSESVRVTEHEMCECWLSIEITFEAWIRYISHISDLCGIWGKHINAIPLTTIVWRLRNCMRQQIENCIISARGAYTFTKSHTHTVPFYRRHHSNFIVARNGIANEKNSCFKWIEKPWHCIKEIECGKDLYLSYNFTLCTHKNVSISSSV